MKRIVVGIAMATLSLGAQTLDKPELRLLTDNGGRVSWYKGTKHELLAFDALSSKDSDNTEVYVIEPDGSGRRCVTCDSGTPKGYLGQPDWHPDGEHIVFQAENENSAHRNFNHVAWGIDNDLWIVRRDGKGAERIFRTARNHGVLHPHFSKDGRMLVFAERTPTGRRARGLARLIGPEGESQWTGWRIHLADFDLDKRGEGRLSNHRTFQPNGPGVYETHGFAPDGRILYTYTGGDRQYMDDIYAVGRDGRNPENLTNSPDTWEEHGHYSPDGRLFAFMSSRIDRSFRGGRSRPMTLKTELYVQREGEEPVRITDVNSRARRRRLVVSDLDWDRTGSRIVFQVAVLDGSVAPELWIATLRK